MMETRSYRVLLAFVVGLMVAGRASAVPAEGTVVSETDLRQYEYEIELATLKFLQQALNPAKVAEEYGLQPPVYPPSLDRERVRGIIQSEVDQVVEKYYPRSRKEEILNYAEKYYRLYKPGDQVRLRCLNRLAQWETREGILDRIGSNGVELDGKAIVKINIHDSEYPHLYLEAHERAVAQMQEIAMTKYEAHKRDFTNRERRKISQRIWREYGYVKLRDRDEWIPRQEYFERKYKKQWDTAYKQVRETMRTTVLNRRGYQRDDVSGEWTFVGVPPEAEVNDPSDVGLTPGSILWKLRDVFESVKKEDLEIEVEKDIEEPAAPPPAEDIWGM